jgi:hypothetical protein
MTCRCGPAITGHLTTSQSMWGTSQPQALRPRTWSGTERQCAGSGVATCNNHRPLSEKIDSPVHVVHTPTSKFVGKLHPSLPACLVDCTVASHFHSYFQITCLRKGTLCVNFKGAIRQARLQRCNTWQALQQALKMGGSHIGRTIRCGNHPLLGDSGF